MYTSNMNHSAHIESILFYKARPVKMSYLMHTLGIDRDVVEAALGELQEQLNGRGVVLQQIDDMVQLVTDAESSAVIEKITTEDVAGDLGKAGLETLTIILYYGPVTRSEIDYIRGVNSTYSLRILLVRGLVERVDNPQDKRAHLYRATFDTLQLLGVKKVTELPDYETLRLEIENFITTDANNENTEENILE